MARRIPSSLCRRVFKRQEVLLLAGRLDLVPAILHVHSRRLRCTQRRSHLSGSAPHAGYPQAVVETTHLGLRGSRVHARMPLRIALQP